MPAVFSLVTAGIKNRSGGVDPGGLCVPADLPAGSGSTDVFLLHHTSRDKIGRNLTLPAVLHVLESVDCNEFKEHDVELCVCRVFFCYVVYFYSKARTVFAVKSMQFLNLT